MDHTGGAGFRRRVGWASASTEYNPKLIEVTLPLAAINEVAGDERSWGNALTPRISTDGGLVGFRRCSDRDLGVIGHWSIGMSRNS